MLYALFVSLFDFMPSLLHSSGAINVLDRSLVLDFEFGVLGRFFFHFTVRSTT